MSLQTNGKPRLLRFSLIRTRLTLWIVTIVVVGMLTFVLTTLVVANTLLQRQNEVRLQQMVLSLSTALAQEPDPNLSAVRSELDAFGTPENYLQYQNQQGVPMASSSNLGRLVLPLSQLRPAITANRVDVLVLHSTSFFMYGHTVVTRGQIQGYVLGAHTVTDSETLNFVFTLLFMGGGVILAALTLLVWLLVRRMLRPLEHLAVSASDIARISDHALRVQARERPDEINSLAQTINGMLTSLEGAYRDVQNVNDLQRRFLADVSHELRTPLTIMLSSLDLMKKERGGDPEFQAKALENIQLEAQRMARMVTQLLILARTDASASMAREPLLVMDLVDDVCRKARLAESKLTLESRELDLVEGAVVLGHADYLKQVFLILLENACKYIPEGGKVEVSGTLNEDTLAITVADTGIGIAESDRSRVFDRFYRAGNARFRSGMELGLSIAQSVAEQHGGTITLESTGGQGSRSLAGGRKNLSMAFYWARHPLSRKEYDTMIRVNIFYPNMEGGRFDLEYYLNTHMPMAIEKLGSSLKGVSIEHGVSGVQPGTQPAYRVMCNYTFDSAEAFLAAFLPHAQVLQGDMPNYTDIEPVMQFSEIKLS